MEEERAMAERAIARRRMGQRRVEPNMFLMKMQKHKQWARNLIWSAPLEEDEEYYDEQR